MAKEIKLKISLDGGKQVEAQVDAIGDGLRDLDSRNAKEAVEALKSLGKVPDLKNAAKQIKDFQQAANGLDDKSVLEFSQTLKARMDAAANSGEDYLNVLRRFKPELDQLAANLKSGSISQEDYNRRLAMLPPIMQRVIAESRKVGNEIQGVGEKAEQAKKKLDFSQIGSQIQSLGQGITNLGQKLTVSLSAPILGLSALAIKSFANVELAVASISTIKPEIDTSQVLSALNEMSTRIPQTAQELGDGLYNIFSSINVTQSEGLKLLENFGRGATAAQTDAKTFGTAVLGVMNAYKLSVSDASHISDVFFNTVNLGVVNGQELATSLGEVTQAAKNAGVGFDELGALIVGVTKEGGNASQNINNLSNFLQKLPTKEASAALKQLGVDIQIDGKFRPTIEVLTDLKSKLDAMAPSARALALQKIFPDAQARTGAQTLLSQLDAVKEAFEVNKTTAGAADKAYQKIAVTASVQFSLLKNTSIAILAEIGSAILPVLQPMIIWIAQTLVPAVKQAVETFKTWSPEMKTVAVAVSAFAASMGPVLLVLGAIVAAIGGFIGAISSIATGLAALTVAGTVAAGLLLVGKALLIIGGVIAVAAVAVAALFAAWQTNFGGIREFTAEVAEQLKILWNSAMSEISQITAEVSAEVTQFWAANGEDIMAAITKVSAFVQRGLQAISSFWKSNGDTVKSIVESVWGNIKTAFMTGVRIIGQLIKLVTAVINGDWSKAGEALVNIWFAGWEAIKTILKNSVSGIYNILKLLAKGMIAALQFAADETIKVGVNIVQGLILGMKQRASDAYSEAKQIIWSVLNVFRNVPIIKSPSKVTTEIGEYLAEGLIVGMKKRAAKVVAAAKKLMQDTLKAFREAAQEFGQLAGASPDIIQTILQTDRIKDATSSQQEIIKLRKELGINQSLPLPNNVAGTEAERAQLQIAKEKQDEFKQSLEELSEKQKDFNEAREQGNKLLEEKIRAIEQSGALELLNLQEQISLTGLTSEAERERIKNYYEIEKLRLQMANDGYGEAQVDEAEKTLRAEQAKRLELQRILDIRKQVAAAAEFERDLLARLFDLQNGNRELSEYEKTLRRINSDWKDISSQQKENLLNVARQIDAQKEFNDQYQETYDLIRGVLDTLTESGTSFGEKMKSIFAGIFDRFKKMLFDMTAAWLTSKIFKAAGQGSGGFNFGNLLQIFTGGGAGGFGGGTPPFNPNLNFTGAETFTANGAVPIGGGGGMWGGWNTIKADKAKLGGIFGGGKMTLAGGLGLAGMAASVIGGMIGGRTGNVISMAGTGLSIGSMFGGPIGGAIGAGIGALVGLFMGDPKRKRDKKEKLPALNKGFTDAFNEMQQLIEDVRFFRTDPDGALSKARELRSQISSGFGLSFESKKYRTESRKIIAAKLAEFDKKPDGLYEQLKQAVEIAKAAGDRQKRILPEFAGGVYFADYFKPNGLLPGIFDAKDNILSLLSKGEMVLNPAQQARVRSAAGFDVFSLAQIPNYPRANPSGRMATGGITGGGIAISGGSPTIIVQPNFTLYAEGINFDERAKMWIESDDGKRTTVNVIIKEKRGNSKL